MTAMHSRRAFLGWPTALARSAPPAPPEPAVPMLAVIAATCLAENGAYCRTCGEACPEGAIRFRLMPHGRARVDVDPDRCNGCGDCQATCPTDAISLSQPMEAAREG